MGNRPQKLAVLLLLATPNVWVVSSETDGEKSGIGHWQIVLNGLFSEMTKTFTRSKLTHNLENLMRNVKSYDRLKI